MNDLTLLADSRARAVTRCGARSTGGFAAIFGWRRFALLVASLLLVFLPSAVLAEESTATETITGVIETIHADGSITLTTSEELVLADGFDAILEEESTIEFAVESGAGTIDDPYVVVGATFLGMASDDDEPDDDPVVDAGAAAVDGSDSRTVHVTGLVTAYDGTSITVGIVTMHIDSSAERGIDIRGTIDVGVRVKLHGKHNADGVLVADQIKVVTADTASAEAVDEPDRFRVRGGRFDIRGTLESVEGNVYVINGTPVIADPNEVERLELHGDLVPDTRVRAKGQVADSEEDGLVFFATEIKPLYEADAEAAEEDEARTQVRGSRFELRGVVTALDTELELLTVNDQEIDFGGARIKGDLALEVFVKVRGTIDADGIYVASRVDVEAADNGDGEAVGIQAATESDDDDGDSDDADDGDSDDTDDGDSDDSDSSGLNGGSGSGSSNSGEGSSGSGGAD